VRGKSSAHLRKAISVVHDLRAAGCGPWQMHGGNVNKKLPARPNLDHLRGQAKTLLAQLKDGDAAAAKAFRAHLPSSRGLSAEAGETCQGIFALAGDELILCLGVVGAPRPAEFATRAGSGHALEHLRRASKARPANVSGGTPVPAPAVAVGRADPLEFEVPLT